MFSLLELQFLNWNGNAHFDKTRYQFHLTPQTHFCNIPQNTEIIKHLLWPIRKNIHTLFAAAVLSHWFTIKSTLFPPMKTYPIWLALVGKLYWIQQTTWLPRPLKTTPRCFYQQQCLWPAMKPAAEYNAQINIHVDFIVYLNCYYVLHSEWIFHLPQLIFGTPEKVNDRTL